MPTASQTKVEAANPIASAILGADLILKCLRTVLNSGFWTCKNSFPLAYATGRKKLSRYVLPFITMQPLRSEKLLLAKEALNVSAGIRDAL